ncbi:5'/3'-nucleotidase SurE [Halothiobacillus diazotrophicus]|uniref:5'-nucleotidase SurE n=1 Tax=Halothiobacillus diazotrophicus TaxID=1860122 RepID=A0A191ZIZ1_9GAMM|nr:5'/3'-nucleotidase SurE [Halothiobacillus diazotrophicus]ANJ67854.1 5'/3'-nucleotidase SurE [Halothiobacillus diazotrophicus]
MNFLVSNDDGYLSPGVRVLATRLKRLGSVTIVAPDRDRSGASNSLTLSRPLRPRLIEPGVWAVDGTPSDCVHLAIQGLLPEVPDLVVSGINHGANLGDDVLYSGTVAAATEGRSLGLPAIAVSSTAHVPQHLDAAADVVADLVGRLVNHPLPALTLLNVNVPDLPADQLKSMIATRLGRRHPSSGIVRDADPRGREIFWIGAAGEGADAGEGTDFAAVAAGHVSVTPIQFDMTRHGVMDAVSHWLA